MLPGNNFNSEESPPISVFARSENNLETLWNWSSLWGVILFFSNLSSALSVFPCCLCKKIQEEITQVASKFSSLQIHLFFCIMKLRVFLCLKSTPRITESRKWIYMFWKYCYSVQNLTLSNCHHLKNILFTSGFKKEHILALRIVKNTLPLRSWSKLPSWTPFLMRNTLS